MRTYRKAIGWAVRIVIAPVLVLWMASLFASRLLAEVMERTLGYAVEFAARVEEWSAQEPDSQWRFSGTDSGVVTVVEHEDTQWTDRSGEG
jgi:hypothetical protein